MFKEYIKVNASRFVALGIMTAVTFAVGVAITGDVSNAFAGRGK